MELQELIGKSIDKVFVDADRQHWIRFVTTDGENLDYVADGDCCSESWIWAISGVEDFRWRPSTGEIRTVIGVEEVELPKFIKDQITRDGLCRQDCDDVYSYKIQLQWGNYVELEFRNSSNGYYGGGLELSKAPADVRWIEVKNDFIADQKLND